MILPFSFFDTSTKGSGKRATLQWIAEHPDAQSSMSFRRLMAEHILGFWVWQRWPGSYGMAFLSSSPDLQKHEEMLRKIITEGYRDQLKAVITFFHIEQLKPR